MRLFIHILTTISFISTLSLNAALPPLTQEEREEEASDIASGYIVSLDKKVINDAGFVETLYRTKLVVTDVIKGSMKNGQTINLAFNRLSYPDGYTGPVGQARLPDAGQKIRAYMLKDEVGQYFLLEPNGFDVE